MDLTSLSSLPTSYPSKTTLSDDDPPEDIEHGVNKFQEEQFKKDQATYLAAIKAQEVSGLNSAVSYSMLSIDCDGESKAQLLEPKFKAHEEEEEEVIGLNPVVSSIDSDLDHNYGESKAQLLEPKFKSQEEEEVIGLDSVVSSIDSDLDHNYGESKAQLLEPKFKAQEEKEVIGLNSVVSSIDSDLDHNYGESKAQLLEPKFKMSLAELLNESKVVPISVYGDLEIEITGIQYDSGLVCSGDLFVFCVGTETDGNLYLSEVGKRGAVAVVASKKEVAIDVDETTFGCKALVIVEDSDSVHSVLAASFYGNPSRNMSVIGVTGTNGKTTTTYLIKSVYEAMALRTGMFGTVAYYIHGDNKLKLSESLKTTPDADLVQKLMAKMLHNGTKTVVMEASSHGLKLGRCDEIDFDVAVFTNFTRDHMDFHESMEDYRDSKAKLFARMVDPDRHRKIVNIDDPNAPFFIAQGNNDVPVVTFAMEDKSADVHPLKFELSLFKTQVLVNTPQGILEISSGLLGRYNIYNILAAVAVGIAVGAPLENIVRGIEGVDGVPGRFELIDEEHAFAVVVDYAHTPDALSRLLDAVRELGPRRIITVFGCGGERDRGKRPIMAKIATEKSDVTLFTSDNPRKEDPLDILDDMLSGVGWSMQDYLKYGDNDYYPPLPNGNRLFVHANRRVAIRAAVAMGEEGDIVVVAGKGHETYQIEGDRKEYFDDREECREALKHADELR